MSRAREVGNGDVEPNDEKGFKPRHGATVEWGANPVKNGGGTTFVCDESPSQEPPVSPRPTESRSARRAGYSLRTRPEW